MTRVRCGAEVWPEELNKPTGTVVDERLWKALSREALPMLRELTVPVLQGSEFLLHGTGHFALPELRHLRTRSSGSVPQEFWLKTVEACPKLASLDLKRAP